MRCNVTMAALRLADSTAARRAAFSAGSWNTSRCLPDRAMSGDTTESQLTGHAHSPPAWLMVCARVTGNPLIYPELLHLASPAHPSNESSANSWQSYDQGLNCRNGCLRHAPCFRATRVKV